jgi:DNA-binding NarL/FixJ family response regulator
MVEIGVMLVDDEADIRLVMRSLIDAADEGLAVVGEAIDGESALDLIEALDPTIVVLDERTPGLTGLETAARLLDRRPGQLIVLCSAFLDAELRERALALGARSCIGKGDLVRLPELLRGVASDAA